MPSRPFRIAGSTHFVLLRVRQAVEGFYRVRLLTVGAGVFVCNYAPKFGQAGTSGSFMYRVRARHAAPHSLRTERPEFTDVALAYRFEPRRFWMFGPIAGRPPNHFPRDQDFVSGLGCNRSGIGCGLGAVPDPTQNVAILVETAYRNHGIMRRARMLLSNVIRALDYPPPLFLRFIVS